MPRKDDKLIEWTVGNDGDTHMDESAGTKRSADEAGISQSTGGTRGRRTIRVEDAALMGPEDGGDNQMVAARAASGGSSNAPSKETPISRYPSLSYGLQETHTTIIPFRSYCSVKASNYELPQKMEFRLNSIYDIVKHQVSGTTTTTAALGDGIYNYKLINGAGSQVGTKFALFPSTLTAGSDSTERPFWRDYWASFYEYYTVLGCKYKITIVNTTSNVTFPGGGDMEFAYEMDSYSQAQGAAGNVMTVGPYHEVRGYKNVKWTTAHAGIPINSNDYVTTIAGEYRPGMVRHNIVNDGDIKTWTKISDGSPTNTDTLVILAFPGDMAMSTRVKDDTTTISNLGCNVRIELDYIVQFKDLQSQARYPSTNTSSAITAEISKDATDDVRGKPGTSGTISA
uniref:Uncharacterized protein n=1 Tax=Forsythia suspensa parvo-like virus TaxID=2739858 RepID=A0A6M9BKF8_9VIRU|nr:hypothetical protein 3 [Forsythia suspensa parvo-like virus]